MLFACEADIRTREDVDVVYSNHLECVASHKEGIWYGTYDTTQLSGGYDLIFKEVFYTYKNFDVKMRQVELWKDTLIAVVDSLHYAWPNIQDYPTYFLLTETANIGTEAYAFDKKTGASLLGCSYVTLVDVTPDGQYILIVDEDSTYVRLGLLDIYTGRREVYTLPSDIIQRRFWEATEIAWVNKREFAIEYETNEAYEAGDPEMASMARYVYKRQTQH